MRFPLSLVLVLGLCGFQPAKAPTLTLEIRRALDAIRPGDMRGDVSFLASDRLEGRYTPSRGLDLAAEYIAAQFRSAGLEAGGDDGYFQTANMIVAQPELTGFELRLSQGSREVRIKPADVDLRTSGVLDVHGAPLFKLDLNDSPQVEAFTPAQVEGRVILIQRNRNSLGNYRLASRKLGGAKPAAIIIIDRAAGRQETALEGRLIDPDRQSDPGREAIPRITVAAESAAAFYEAVKPGTSGATAYIHIGLPREEPVRLHNVIGVLRGSDPALKDTCELLTAHYDHLGKRLDAQGEHIFHGANDDASGTASVIEIARALAKLQPHPRRSILFIAFFGEEEGLIGSNYYAHHPAWPLDKTVAQLNLEQLGRTDSSEGPQVANATVTGFDYSSLTGFFEAAAKQTGIKLYKHPRNSDLYFSASDNLPLAEAGVPAQTLAVTFDFPDYHAPGDEWQKIDYENMAKVDRAVALGLILVASSEQPPQWNAANPKTAPFIKASRALH